MIQEITYMARVNAHICGQNFMGYSRNSIEKRTLLMISHLWR